MRYSLSDNFKSKHIPAKIFVLELFYLKHGYEIIGLQPPILVDLELLHQGVLALNGDDVLLDQLVCALVLENLVAVMRAYGEPVVRGVAEEGLVVGLGLTHTL